MIIELQRPFPVSTPHGDGYAHFLVDHGKENDNEWIVFLDNNEIWSFLNREVRLKNNYTYGRRVNSKFEQHKIKAQNGKKET